MRSANRAFTFIELMVVVIIMAIAAAVAVPMMSQDSVRIPAAARMVGSDLGYAQNIATARQTEVQITFQKTGSQITGYQVKMRNSSGTFEFVNRPADLTPMAVTFGPTQGSSLFGACLIGSAALNSSPKVDFTQLSFNSRGQPSYHNGTEFVPLPSDARISVTDLNGKLAATVSIQPVTGVVRVE